MKLLTRLAVLFYVTTILFIGCFTLLFVLHVLDYGYVSDILYGVYTDIRLRWFFGIIAVLFLVKNFVYANAISDRRQMEKTIAFDNPTGRVSVSLTAMEDLVKRVLSKFPEVKESKPSIVATKRGLDMEVRLILKADVNIPDFTAGLQEAVRRKIQDAIGLEEPVSVRMHVVKIMAGDIKTPQTETPYPNQRSVPFQGYRA